MRQSDFVLAIVLVVLALTARPAGAALELGRSVFGTGGGTSTSPSHAVRSTAGQPATGNATSASHTIRSGFWHGTSVVVATPESPSAGPPAIFTLSQNHPNPFNPSTRISYDVPAAGGHVRLLVFDVAGRPVRTLVDDQRPPGRYVVDWDGLDDGGRPGASGVYFYQMDAPGFHERRKMLLLK